MPALFLIHCFVTILFRNKVCKIIRIEILVNFILPILGTSKTLIVDSD